MNSIARSISVGAVCMLMIFVSMPLASNNFATGRAATQSSKPAACSALEYRQFDFWAGDWDAFEADNPNTPVARTRVDRILDGCVLLEDYQDTNGSHGQSFSIYDASRRVWHQSWVTGSYWSSKANCRQERWS